MTPGSDTVYFLLVDDLEENLQSLEALLRREGLTLLKARSGDDALELLLQHEVALALLDVHMPGMSGFELAELMRGNERTRRVPIIFLTAAGADSRRRFQGYEAGAVDFLDKPLNPDILRSKAQVFFELSRQRQQLARQRDELRSYTEALQEADRRKDEFLAVLAHELRNPLAPLRYGLEILKLTPDEETFQEVHPMIERQVQHLVRLIDDLLDVSRISRGRIDLRKEVIVLQSAVAAAIEASLPLLNASNHTFTSDIPSDPVWVEADATRLAQVISNVLNNSAKYTPPGGRVHLSVSSLEGEAEISIRDSGLGIPQEMLTEVFELFTQVEAGGDQSHGGLGIGLALARQLTGLHGGSIRAESAGPGKGSTFYITLPRLPAGPPEPRAGGAGREPLQSGAGAESAATRPSDSIEARTLSVLVVDDNTSAVESTARLLQLMGHRTASAFTGPEALELARRIQPDVILLDLGLPGMSGIDVCRALRAESHFHRTLMIAQTGWGQESDRQRTREAGFDHHLTKPVDLQELTRLLEGR